MRKLLIALGVCVSVTVGSSSVAVAGFDERVAANERDPRATTWKVIRVLAERGEATWQFALGSMYKNGTGVAQDDKEAVKWYRKAAEQGYMKAQNALGVMYEKGRGGAQDDKEAVKWYRKAAEQGEAFARYNLGVMYAKGRGVAQDYVQAYMWFDIGAANGDGEAKEHRDKIEKLMTAADISKAQTLAKERMAKHQK